MKVMNNLIKYFLVLMLFFQLFTPNNVFATDTLASASLAKDLGKVRTVAIGNNSLEETMNLLGLPQLETPQTRNVFENIYTSTQTRTTQTYTKMKFFESKFTCQGITANLNDIVPYIVDLIETIIESIPEYAIKKAIGKDISNPGGSYEMIMEVMMNIYCLIKVIPSTVGTEQGIKAIPELISNLFTTNKSTTEIGVQGSNGSSPYIDALVDTLGLGGVSINQNGASKTGYKLAGDVMDSIMKKNTKCVEGLRIWVNDVLTPSIKNFRPLKIKSQKSYCEMADTYKKQTSGNNIDLVSPLRWKVRKDRNAESEQEVICVEDQFQKVCRNTDPDKQKAMSKVSDEKMKEILNDGIKLPNLSNKLVNNFTSKELFTLGYHIVDSLTICINNPTMNVCREIDCTIATDKECQGDMERTKNIPFKYTLDSMNSYEDYKDNYVGFDSLLMKLKMKKIQCLRMNIMNTEEKHKFIKSFSRIFNAGLSRNFEGANFSSTEAVELFDRLILDEFCGNHMNVQVNEYDNVVKSKIFNIKLNNVKQGFKVQQDLSQIQRLKMLFNKATTSPQLRNIVEVCTFIKSGDKKQTEFSALKRKSSGDLELVKLSVKNVYENNESEFTHVSAEFQVEGKCEKNASNKCIALKCEYIDTEITQAYNKTKQDSATSKVISRDKMKLMTKTEFVEKIEKDRIKTYENIYNKYNNYEKQFTDKVLTPQLIRYMIESGYFIY